MLLNPSNLLLLDEPTNHLDLDSKDVLLDALADYGGTLIFVSHDRYFVDRLATKVIEIGGGEALLYPGGYEDFVFWKKQRESGLEAPLPTPERKTVHHLKASPEMAPRAAVEAEARAHTKVARPPAPGRAKTAASANPDTRSYDPLAPRLRPKGAPEDRQAREREARKLKNQISDLERKVAEKEQAVKDLEHLMASPGFYEDRVGAEKAVAERQALLDELTALMSEWESLQGAVEAVR